VSGGDGKPFSFGKTKHHQGHHQFIRKNPKSEFLGGFLSDIAASYQ